MNFEGNSDPDHSDDRWIFGSTHVWNDERLTLSEHEGHQAYGEHDWAVIVHWRMVDGRAMPVGFEVRSSLWGARSGDPWPEADTPKEITRELFKRLPVGQIIRDSREQLAEAARWAYDEAPNPVATEVQQALDQTGTPEDSPSDWKYRETAKAYAAALADPRTDRSRIAQATWNRLQQHEHPELRKISYERARKNISKARERGYLPPATKTTGRNQRPETTHTK